MLQKKAYYRKGGHTKLPRRPWTRKALTAEMFEWRVELGEIVVLSALSTNEIDGIGTI